jgi:hypothetical protein
MPAAESLYLILEITNLHSTSANLRFPSSLFCFQVGLVTCTRLTQTLSPMSSWNQVVIPAKDERQLVAAMPSMALAGPCSGNNVYTFDQKVVLLVTLTTHQGMSQRLRLQICSCHMLEKNGL